MNENKKNVIVVFIVVWVIVIGGLVAYKLITDSVTDRSNFNFEVEDISSNPVETENHEKIAKVKELSWEELTENGVDDELLFKNIDIELVNQIVAELQTLVEEAKEEEIVIAKEWEKIREHERYKKVLNMGSSAIKPLYLIIYESLDEGEYEYLCARTLCELAGFNFHWTNSKDFLESFNQKIIKIKQ